MNNKYFDFSIVLVENIPDDLSLPMDVRHHLPLSAGFHSLLDRAKHSVEVVSSAWNLNSWDVEPKPRTAEQVRAVVGSSAEHKANERCHYKCKYSFNVFS